MEIVSDLPHSAVRIAVYRGEMFTASSLMDASGINGELSSCDYFTHQNDIFVVGYPKCGSTWLQRICLRLVEESKIDEIYSSKAGKTASLPFFELMTQKQFDRQVSKMNKHNGIRLWRSHFSYHHFKKYTKQINKNTKFIYIVRNPKDTLISYYFFRRNHDFWGAQFQTSMKNRSVAQDAMLFCSGIAWYGNYWDHIISWYNQKYYNNDENILFLYYEDVLTNPQKWIKIISKFIKTDEFLDDLKYEKILNDTSFGNMKKEMLKHKLWVSTCGNNFFRNAKIDDWKNYFDSSLSDTFDNITFLRFFNTNIKYFQQLPNHITQNRIIRSKL